MNWKLKSQIVLIHGNQRRFAEVLGICESIVSMVTRGRYNLSDEEKILWSRKLQCSPEEIFESEVIAQ